MDYEKQNFKNGQLLTAECLNRMEDGIKGACDAVPPACDKADRSKILSHGEKGCEWIDYPVQTKDATVGDNAWSSKITVDRLCPPINESGIVVQCEPVEGYHMAVTVTSVPCEVTVCGKNLYDPIKYPLVDGYFINKGNGDVNGTGTHESYCATLEYIPVSHLRGRKINLNKIPGGSAPGVAFYDADKVRTDPTLNGKGDNQTVPDNAVYMRFCTYIDQKDEVQIELGSVATVYEPYASANISVDDSVVEITALKGVNTVFAYSGNNPVEIMVSGRANPKAVINSLMARVEALENAAVGNT